MVEPKRKYITWLRNAVSRSRKKSPVQLTPKLSPASTAEKDYVDVPVPEVIAELCIPSGDQRVDFVHSILIDLIQHGYIRAVRNVEKGLGYLATDEGHKYVEETLSQQVDEFLGVMFNDQ